MNFWNYIKGPVFCLPWWRIVEMLASTHLLGGRFLPIKIERTPICVRPAPAPDSAIAGYHLDCSPANLCRCTAWPVTKIGSLRTTAEKYGLPGHHEASSHAFREA